MLAIDYSKTTSKVTVKVFYYLRHKKRPAIAAIAAKRPAIICINQFLKIRCVLKTTSYLLSIIEIWILLCPLMSSYVQAFINGCSIKNLDPFRNREKKISFLFIYDNVQYIVNLLYYILYYIVNLL